jgi:hypothetical protein
MNSKRILKKVGIFTLFALTFSVNNAFAQTSPKYYFEERGVTFNAWIPTTQSIIGIRALNASYTVQGSIVKNTYVVVEVNGVFYSAVNIPPASVSIDVAQGISYINTAVECGAISVRIDGTSSSIEQKMKNKIRTDGNSTSKLTSRYSTRYVDRATGTICGVNLDGLSADPFDYMYEMISTDATK